MDIFSGDKSFANTATKANRDKVVRDAKTIREASENYLKVSNIINELSKTLSKEDMSKINEVLGKSEKVVREENLRDNENLKTNDEGR